MPDASRRFYFSRFFGNNFWTWTSCKKQIVAFLNSPHQDTTKNATTQKKGVGRYFQNAIPKQRHFLVFSPVAP
jgi:hypothetical protein